MLKINANYYVYNIINVIIYYIDIVYISNFDKMKIK